MRGGALPILTWALILSVSGTLNAIWTGDLIQIGTFAAAVFAELVLFVALIVRNPVAIRRGEPARVLGAEAIPTASFGAAFTAIGCGTLLFGLAFGHFLVYLGAGMIVAGLGKLAVERHAQRRAIGSAQAGTGQTTPPPPGGTR